MSNATVSLDNLTLSHGNHPTRDDGVCIMEAVAWLAGEQHSDKPQCASPVITAFAIGLNDAWDDEWRQRLVPYTKLIVNTRDEFDQQRGLMTADWVLRTYTPTWLRLAGCTAEAEVLEGHAALTDWSALADFMADLDRARSRAAAARAAARAAASAAAWAAASDAASDAAWAAARAAASDAAWAAASDAASDAAWDAAADAAWAAAWDAAWAAAWDARAALAPTVNQLRESVLDLLDRMCRIGTNGH